MSAAKGLVCKGIGKSFDGFRAIDDVSVEFSGGGVTALIGPNGAGKTTLLNLLTGFLRPDTGRYWIRGEEVQGLAPDRIARLGVARTFQELRIIRELSVLENVLLACPSQTGETFLGAVLRHRVGLEESRNKETAMGLLQRVGLVEHASRPAGNLSYGQQKLLTLACCLATDAPILLLDEPLAGVHPTTVTTVLELLAELAKEREVVLFVEHDISAVRRAAERVVVMDHGSVIADGAPDDVLSRAEIMDAYVG